MAEYTLKIKAGETFRRIFTWSAGDPLSPVDLTSWTARSQIRRYAEDSSPTVSLTSGPGGGITLGGAAGTIELVLSDTQTQIPWRQGRWDLELISPTNEVKRLLMGPVEVSPEITR